MNDKDAILRKPQIRYIKDLLKDVLKAEWKEIDKELKEYDTTVSLDNQYSYDIDIVKSKGINAMDTYFWINITCNIKKGTELIKEENYCITLFQQDIDLSTGNFHLHKDGKIQVWRDLIKFKGCENGGEIRLKPIKIEDDWLKSVLKSDSTESLYAVYHAPFHAHPVALPYGQRNQKAKHRLNKPWGIALEDIGVPILPSMDMAEDTYSTHDLVKFIYLLIKADIKQKIGALNA